MIIKAFQSRYNLRAGEFTSLLIAPEHAENWYGRDPFESPVVQDVSSNLVMSAQGTADGHNLVIDSTFTDSLRSDPWVPVSPLFVKDLAGRIIYIGFGPERKANVEWVAYQVQPATEGAPSEDEGNAFVPLVVFPRFCRDTERMEGVELLEQVFLTKFRCLEMSFAFNGTVSGGDDDEESLVAATYLNANLYPYKLRLDTFYTDGFKLPQTQMLYAKGSADHVNPAAAKRLGEQLLEAWTGRAAGTSYSQWFAALGQVEVDRLYDNGCTVIPTFEACNGYHVVERDFGLDDYWPGRAVIGLHDVVERVANQAPAGTIVDVVEPGFVTATRVRMAKVIVSDGSGYVSPNAEDPAPLRPNLYMPHSRVIDSWLATWIPTHPEHFEAPALWGWDLNMGRFMQLSGPLWDPLHYYYESVDHVLAAFDATAVSDDKPLVAVPHAMEHRFFPVIPMQGFDTFSDAAYKDRKVRKVGPVCSLKRIATADYTAGIGYHPLPAEFEFELDPFWFPEMHPLNRAPDVVPEELDDLIVPVISPRVTISEFVQTVDASDDAMWMKDESRMFTPLTDPMLNYPFLIRYLFDDIDASVIANLCPTPFLSDPGEKIALPAPAWWLDENGSQLDGPLALQDVATNIHDALWDIRQKGVEIVQFRHMVYRTNLPLYVMAWWYSWSIEQISAAMNDWIKESEAESALLDIPAGDSGTYAQAE